MHAPISFLYFVVNYHFLSLLFTGIHFISKARFSLALNSPVTLSLNFFYVITQLFVWLNGQGSFMLLYFSPIKHSDHCRQNRIINEDFSHSGPLITMATPSAANGHIAKMLLKRTASHTAAVQMSFSYLSFVTMLTNHLTSKHLSCTCEATFVKNQESRIETTNERERPI